MFLGLSLNHQSIFDSLSHTLFYSGDVEEVYPDVYTGLFNLVEAFSIATAIISSTTTVLPLINSTYEIPTINFTTESITEIPRMDNLYITEINLVPKIPSQTPFEWFYKQLTHFGVRGLLIGSILSICLLVFLLFLILHLHCKNRHKKSKLSYQYNQTNGTKTYSQLKHSSPHILCCSQKSSPKKSSTFRLKPNGSIARLNSSDSYHLISAIQESHKEKNPSSYQNSDCILNEHCCLHSQPIYHQVNHLMKTNPQPILSPTLRSVKKDIDNSSAQTYSAVYSCELAANLDIEQDLFSQNRSSIKRRSVLKMNQSNLIPSQILFLYMKNLVDCFAIQPSNHETILLATVDENRIQLYHIRVSNILIL